MFKKLPLLILVFFAVFAISSCFTGTERYCITQLRNDSEIADASLNFGLDSKTALSAISNSSKAAADKVDPDKECPPISTAPAIAQNPQYELQKIFNFISAGPSTGWLNWTSIVGGVAVFAGIAGQLLGPPYNIIGNAIQGLAQRTLPDYKKTKTAVVGAIASTDQMLTDYGSLLDTMPEVKAKLTEKMGGDPVTVMKKNLQNIQTDLGTQPEIAALMAVMKAQMTTQNGVLTPTVQDLDKYLAGKI